MREVGLFRFAIYDTNNLLKDLLHNKLQYFGYNIAFACSSTKELFMCLRTQPCLFITGIEKKDDGFLKTIKQVHKEYPKMKMLFYGDEKILPASFLKNVPHLISASSFYELIKNLEKILPEHPLHKCREEKMNGGLNISTTDPFYPVISNAKKYEVLKLAAIGKSTKEIALIVKLDYNSIETYRKQIIHETNCNNLIEVVAKAKDLRII